jgi:hypothetical protein
MKRHLANLSDFAKWILNDSVKVQRAQGATEAIKPGISASGTVG